MKDNFFNSMFSEGGKISHKRWIGVTLSATLVWVIIYSTMKANAAPERLSIIIATMCFIGVIVGVATLPQIITLLRGDKIEVEEPKTPENETK
jgi:xanthosine utilization system XapX-like protein